MIEVKTVKVKNFMRLADWPKDATIRFLDPDGAGGGVLPAVYWRPIHKVTVPLDQVEDLLEVSEPVLGSILRDDWRVKLKPEVEAWCIASLEMNRAYPRRHATMFDFSKGVETVVFTVEFECEKDALHFKLRWIG